jgi:hypothetical protein
MLVASEMMNINESPSTLKEISVRKVLNFTKTSCIRSQKSLFVNLFRENKKITLPKFKFRDLN